tara:strand:+ start:209 stop:715 length:507 start_codon:yes stop_codon:yes gene_type:complete
MIKIVRHYLEIRDIAELNFVKKPNNKCFLEKISPPDFQLNKFFYKQIGKNHRWIDRLSWTDSQWMNYLSNKNVNTFIIKEDKELAGYYESIYDEINSEFEIAYFGILEEYRGKKYGAYLLSEAIKKSLERKIKRVWVHTCSLDHKYAIKNYLSRGMKVYKEDIVKISA